MACSNLAQFFHQTWRRPAWYKDQKLKRPTIVIMAFEEDENLHSKMIQFEA